MRNTSFSKANLLTGDMLVHRNGKVSTVMLDTICGNITRFHSSFNSFSYLKNLNEDLTHIKYDGLDVVRVYRTFDSDRTKVGDAIANPDKMIQDSNLIWVAETDDVDDVQDGAIVLSIADIEKILGYKVAIVG